MQQLAALADPTRLRIVELLAERERSAGELAECFAMSQPAVSRHLGRLRASGLVSVKPEAQRRIYSLEPAPLDELEEWLTKTRAAWELRLDALAVEIERGRRANGGRR